MLPELIYRLNSLISSSIKRNLVNMQLHLHNRAYGTLNPKIILNKEMKSEYSSERGSQNGNISISLQTRLHFISFEKSVSYFVIVSQCRMPNYCVNQETSFVLDWYGKEYNFLYCEKRKCDPAKGLTALALKLEDSRNNWVFRVFPKKSKAIQNYFTSCSYTKHTDL